MNIWLFIGTVFAYAVFWYGSLIFKNAPERSTWSDFLEDSLDIVFGFSLRKHAGYLGIIVLLALPVNINGYVFSIAGNAVGERGVYSLASFYQKSGGDAFSVLGFGYQEATKDALVIAGISIYQKAETVWFGFGISGYQEATEEEEGKDGAGVLFGISAYQKSSSIAWVAVGISGYQEATAGVVTLLGVTVYQKAGEKTRAFGAIVPLKADVAETAPNEQQNSG